MTGEFPEYHPPAGDNVAGGRGIRPGLPMALHLLAEADGVLAKLDDDHLGAVDVVRLTLQAAQVHALIAIASAGQPKPAATLDALDDGETLADLAVKLAATRDGGA